MQRPTVPMLSLVALACATAIACGDSVTTTKSAAPFDWPEAPTMRASLHVRDHGRLEIDLYPSVAPETVANFVKLANEGFYDGTSFHRVIPGFMLQGGDPNTRDDLPGNDGNGGPGYTIADEFNAAGHERGVLSMANRGNPNTGGSQFFIVQGEARHLDGKHTAFGRVVSGMDVVDRISEVECDVHGRWGPKNRPIESVVIDKIEIQAARSDAATL
jgi:peptidyl-prolyl cis-trans isomerase B (cyclophilin B)